MADLVAVMNVGVLNQVGGPQELHDRPANLFVASFIGEPPMNLMAGELREEAGKLCLEGNGLCFSFGSEFAARVKQLRTSKIVIGIRPEHVYLTPGDEKTRGTDDLTGKVFCREPRGDVDILLVQLAGALEKGGQTGFIIRDLLTVEVSETVPLREGDTVMIRFDEAYLHIFDAQTGMNLSVKRE
jgi:ABC-type sugar transport system ATPase subunit